MFTIQNSVKTAAKAYVEEVIQKLSIKYGFPYEEALSFLEAQASAEEEKVSPHEKSKKEKCNLEEIDYHIKNNTPSGQKIKESFKEAFPGQAGFDDILIKGGRGNHFDLDLKWLAPQQRTKTCEYKGSQYKKKIDTSSPPWANAVQFFNGPGNKFTIGRHYAKQFYEQHLDEIIAHFAMVTPKPSYEEWAKDAFATASPKTPFVCELRDKGYQNSKSSPYLSDLRKKYNQNFVVDAAQLQILKQEVFTIANDVLGQKDYWLQINGPMKEPGDFEIRWTGKLAMSEIVQVQQIKNKSGCDVNFQFTCDDGNIFHAKMRWGYGQCITNIRIDLK
jgi:hypothetical protein